MSGRLFRWRAPFSYKITSLSRPWAGQSHPNLHMACQLLSTSLARCFESPSAHKITQRRREQEVTKSRLITVICRGRKKLFPTLKSPFPCETRAPTLGLGAVVVLRDEKRLRDDSWGSQPRLCPMGGRATALVSGMGSVMPGNCRLA